VSEEVRRHESNKIRTESVPFDNPVGDRYNWKRAGRLIKDSMSGNLHRQQSQLDSQKSQS